jgi:hypothetical protein
MRVLDGRQRKPSQRISQARVSRDNDNERLQSGFQEAAGGFAHQRFTTPRFEELLASEPRRLPGREQNGGDQPAGVAVLSSWSTQLAKRCAIR